MPQVTRWLLHESKKPPRRCTSEVGHVRWAFVLAFAALRRQMSYEAGIEWTLNCGGDTDTNAAIVGAMLGALWGASRIPCWMSAPVLVFDPVSCEEGIQRPAMYTPARLMELTRVLVGQGADTQAGADEAL